MTVNKPLRVGVVGAGWWGEQHARAFSSRHDTEVCAVVARSVDSAARRTDRYGGTPYDDLDDMLERERPDLVSLSLPNLEHFEPTMTVLRAGVPTLVEKPLVFNLDQADALLAEADRQNTFFAINFNHRYAKAIQMAQRAIDEGRLGEQVFATWRFGGEGSSAEHPYADLIETQCHAFDQLEALCGPIAAISAEMTDAGSDDGSGTMALSLRFASGAVGSLVGSYRSSYAYRETHRLEVNGTAGRLLVTDTVDRFEYQAAGSETAEVWRAGYFNDPNRSFVQTMDRHMHAIVKALLASDGPPVPASAGKRALVLAHAAIESHETRRRVDVKPPLRTEKEDQ